MSNSLVIIPTYNEKENVEAIIRATFSEGHGFHILIVDDNSPDGTADIVKSLQKEFTDSLFLEIRTEGKQGLGTAYIHGFKWAIQKKYDYIFEMDADFSHPTKDLIHLKEACEKGADVAVGSRYITGVNVVNWPMDRVLMSYYASSYVRFVTRMTIRDTTAGFKCYKRSFLENINFDRIRFRGYAFQIEMKFMAIQLGYKVVEVPIIFVDRTLGESKMSSNIFKEAILGVLRLKWESLFPKRFNKRRIN